MGHGHGVMMMMMMTTMMMMLYCSISDVLRNQLPVLGCRSTGQRRHSSCRLPAGLAWYAMLRFNAA